jgi:D-alanyl-D-alanine carboxypeptidase
VTIGFGLNWHISRYQDPTLTEPNPQPISKQQDGATSSVLSAIQASEQTDEAVLSDFATTDPTQVTTINCTDCTLAAVDKQHSLPSDYAPNVVSTNLPGGGQLTPQATSALQAFFDAAQQEAGLSMEIMSAYRSYQTQASTFESWVQSEIAQGYGRTEAEARANTYSARPGQSEHQLGTTVDLKCAGCASFDAAQNSAVYDYIAQNAHRFGYVISYPQGQDALTGYTYEPWHIRWIGIDIASQLFSTGYTSGNGNYLAQFLRDNT